MGSYFDVIVGEKVFHIVKTPLKPQNEGCASAILEKIEFVIKNNLEYDSEFQDVYSTKSKKELYQSLGVISFQILAKYRFKKSWCLFSRTFLESDKKLKRVCNSIYNRIHPSRLFILPDELIRKVGGYLDFSDLKALGLVNRLGCVHAKILIVERSKELGYAGDDHVGAVKYTDKLFREVIDLADKRTIPSEYFSYKSRGFFTHIYNPEGILSNLQSISTEDLFRILSKEIVYSENFQNFRNRLNSQVCEKVSKDYSESVQKKRNLALFLAAENGEKNICEFLLNLGVPINVKDRYDQTPLALAVIKNKEEVVKFLVDRGADVDTRKRCGNTPLLLSRSADVTLLLLQSGRLRSINSVNQDGFTALHLAAKRGDLEQVKAIVSHGANINARDRHEHTPLTWAAIESHKEIVKFLIDNGADVNSISTLGNSVLMFSDSAEITLLLLQSGRLTSINHQNNQQKTALHYAVAKGDYAQVVALIEHGANINAKDSKGNTPFDMFLTFRLRYGQHILLENYLIEHGAAN